MSEQPTNRPTLTLDGIRYDVEAFNDELKVMATDLIRADQKLGELLYETRINQLAKDYLIAQIKQKTSEQGILGSPVN